MNLGPAGRLACIDLDRALEAGITSAGITSALGKIARRGKWTAAHEPTRRWTARGASGSEGRRERWSLGWSAGRGRSWGPWRYGWSTRGASDAGTQPDAADADSPAACRSHEWVRAVEIMTYW